MVGEIHLANIHFTNAVSAKVRPVLLLKVNSFNDIIYLPLTTNLLTNGVLINNNNLLEGFLPKPSMAVYEKPGVIAPGLLIKKIGALNAHTHNLIIHELVSFLKK
jgi:hypothetical protein